MLHLSQLIIPKNMKVLSANGSPLPNLAIRSQALAPDVLANLDEHLIAHPYTRIGGMFWNLTHLMHETLRALQLAGLDSRQVARQKQSVLNNVELMMHWTAALNEYLGRMLQHSLPPAGKKSKSAQAAKERLGARIKRLFKMPINLVKHDSFGLKWIEMKQGEVATHGYFVTGPIGNGTFGPAKFKPRVKESPEGYSFALILREAFIVPFEMSDIAEAALDNANLFIGETSAEAPQHISQEDLAETLTLLNNLPLRGFPDEDGRRVPIFELLNGSIVSTTSPLRRLPGAFNITSELPSVRKGGTYKLPYFGNSG